MRLVILLTVLSLSAAYAGLSVSPEFAGSGSTDSVIVSFCTFDTTYYPTIVDADSIIALRFGPGNSLVDSLTQSAASLQNPRPGWYEIHYRAADAGGQQGLYRVYVRAKIGGAWRGAASASYQVIAEQLGGYLAGLTADADSIKDTLTALQHSGDPIAVDSAALARAVWDDDVVARFGRRIGWSDTANVVNNIPASGTGAYPCSLLVIEQDGETPIAGVFLRAMNVSETATAAIGRSNAEGVALFLLDAAEYHVYSYLAGYSFSNLPGTLSVSAAGASDTLYASRFDPGEPPTAELCRVYGFINSLGGDGLDEVEVAAAVLTMPLLYEGILISPYRVSTVTDSNGYWYLDLIPNQHLIPTATKYDFTIHDESGTVLRKRLEVPDTVSYRLSW